MIRALQKWLSAWKPCGAVDRRERVCERTRTMSVSEGWNARRLPCSRKPRKKYPMEKMTPHTAKTTKLIPVKSVVRGKNLY